jgi:hypothetical protein
MLPFRAVLSVLRFGIVQFNVTAFPALVADKSVTGSGRFSDGGCGAPGVPQPASQMPASNPAPAHAVRLSKLIDPSLTNGAHGHL